MRKGPLMWWICLIVLLPAATTWAGISVDHDKSADFSKYKTYTLKEGTPPVNQLMRDRLVKAIEHQLAAKGLKKADSGGDLHVVVHTSVDTEKRITADNWGYGGYPRWHGWGGWGTTTVNVSNIKVGTLMLDMVDAGDDKLVWRGIVTDSIPNKAQKTEKKISKAVEKLFRHFPPEEE